MLATAAKYCRRGRVLLVLRESNTNFGLSVIPWPIFRRLMRLDTARIHRLAVTRRFPPFLGNREYRRLLMALRQAG